MRFGQALAKFRSIGVRVSSLIYPSGHIFADRELLAFDFQRRVGEGTIFIGIRHNTDEARPLGAIIPTRDGSKFMVWDGEKFVEQTESDLDEQIRQGKL